MGTDLTNLKGVPIPTKEHSRLPKINLKVEVYSIAYDWGIGEMGRPNFSDWAEPYFQGTLSKQITSANFLIDSTSDIRYTCSLSVILDYDSPFIVHANDNIFWQLHWLKIIKTYEYPNGNLENQHSYDEHVIGWFAPNEGSYDYNAETREFSLSCTDIISFLMDNRGGHLTHWSESLSGSVVTLIPYSYLSLDSVKNSENSPPWIASIPDGLKKDMGKVSRSASGLVLEGEKSLQLQSQQYDNFLSSKNSDNTENLIWKDKYEEYIKEHKDESKNEPWRSNFDKIDEEGRRIKFYWLNENGEWQDVYFTNTNEMVASLAGSYAHIIPINGAYVNLQEGYKLPPYDLEFNGDVTIYDVLKKVTDLFPDQTIYLDSNRRLNAVQNPQPWRMQYPLLVRQNLYGLTLNEQWNVNLENVKNYTVVFGREQTCVGYYYVESVKGLCENCGAYYENVIGAGLNGELNSCKVCGTPLRRLAMINDTFSVKRIGTHKQVIYNDNLITDEECYNAAKALTMKSCRAKRTLSVTIMDRYLPIYNRPDTGIGQLVEYTSVLTGETDLFKLLKWSNDFNKGEVTLELEPCQIQQSPYQILSVPEFSCNITSSGLLTINISKVNGADIYKIYYSKNSLYGEGQNWGLETIDLNFLGETDSLKFEYQFTESGRYKIAVEAWSSTIYRSGVDNLQVVDVDISEDIRVDISTGETSTEMNGNNINIGINYLVTKEGDYITDNDNNKFVY